MVSVTEDCVGDLTTILSEYKWTIPNFSSLCKSDKTYIYSPKFCNSITPFKSVYWQMQMYPNGDETAKKQSKQYVSIYLCLIDPHLYGDDGIALPNCEFIISSSIRVYETKKLTPFSKFNKKANWGFSKAIESNNLLTDLKKGNDVLIIVCKINISDGSPQQKNPLVNLKKDFASLLNARKYCDVTLISKEGIELEAHKVVLICRSKVFSAMFEHNMKESQDDVVKIEDTDYETLEEMLQFMYTGEVKNLQNKSKELLIVADKYELNDLKDMCIYHITENIPVDNVLSLIQFAYLYNLNELKIKAKEYYVKNRKKIMSIVKHENFKDLSQDILVDLVYDLSSL